MLHHFEHTINFQSKRCSTTQTSILRSCYGNVLDAFMRFATSIWTTEEKTQYEDCDCLGHKKDAILGFYRAMKETGGREIEPLQEIIVRIFGLLANVFRRIKPRCGAAEGTADETKWPSSPLQLALGSPSHMIAAFVAWARLSDDPEPICALYAMVNAIPSLGPALDQNEVIMTTVTDLFRHFIHSLQALDFTKLSRCHLQALEYTIIHFSRIFGNRWFQKMKDPILATKHTQILVPLYNILPDLMIRLSVFPFRMKSRDSVTPAFTALGLNIHNALLGTASSVSLHPIFLKNAEKLVQNEEWELASLALAILSLRHVHQCANMNCVGGDNVLQAPFKACAACKVARYCSKECQVSDWKAHKNVCRGLKLLISSAQRTIVATPSKLVRAREAFDGQVWESGLTHNDTMRIIEYVSKRFKGLINGGRIPASSTGF